MRLIERQEGPAIVVGSVGTGKSLLCLTLAESFRHLCRVLVLPCGRLCTRRALLQVILYELGLPYRDMEEGELRLYLIDHLSNKAVCPTGILLLVDEADNLSMALLDELRALTNLTSDGQTCVRLVLFGGPRLEERFAHPRLESFNQRLAGRFYLEPFLRDETIQYIVQQFLESGGDPKSVFRDSGLEAIHQASGGIPRLVNQLTDHAMILVAVGQHAIVDRECVETAWADLQQFPLPNRRHDFAQKPSSNIVEFGDLRDESDDDVERTERRLNDIERHLDQFDSDGRLREPDSTDSATYFADESAFDGEPEVTLYFHSAHDPFGDDFAEEELVVDEFLGAEPRFEAIERPLAWRPTAPPHRPASHPAADAPHQKTSESAAPASVVATPESSSPVATESAPMSTLSASSTTPTVASTAIDSTPTPSPSPSVHPVSATSGSPQATNLTSELSASLPPTGSEVASKAPLTTASKTVSEIAPPATFVKAPNEQAKSPVPTQLIDNASAEAILRSLAAAQFIVEPDYQRQARERISNGPSAPASKMPEPAATIAPAAEDTMEANRPSGPASFAEAAQVGLTSATSDPTSSDTATPSPWNVDAFVARTREPSANEETDQADDSSLLASPEPSDSNTSASQPVVTTEDVEEPTLAEGNVRPADSRGGHNYRQLFSQLRTNRI